MLPKIDYPLYMIKVPSTKENLKFRPFLVKEEKLLLMGKESNEPSDILMAIKQIINNCCVDNIDVNKLCIFDIEYIFLKLRSLSVDNIVKLTYKDFEDEKNYDFEVDLNTIELDYPKTDAVSKNIKLGDNMGIVMKYPSASLYEDKDFLSLEKDYMFELVVRCIDKIYVNDEVYDPSNYSKKELDEFLESLSVKAFGDINDFLSTTPRLYHLIEYKNELGNDRKIELVSLNDFFSWR